MSNELLNQWLQTQCGLLHGVLAGIVYSAANQSDAPLCILYPENTHSLPLLSSTALLSIQHNKPIIKTPKQSENETPSSTQELSTQTIAYPLKLPNGDTAAVAILLQGTNTDLGKQALTHLQKGLPELVELLSQKTGESSSNIRLGKITRLIAVALTDDEFSKAASVLTTELAAELNCERVFLGMIRSRKTRLESISRTAEVAPREAFTLAVIAAMDEASDQHSVITSPRIENNENYLAATIKHDDLKSRFKLASICTVPLMVDEHVIGTLLFEKTASENFTKAELESYQQLGSFLAPILKMKYRIGKPLLSRMRERLSRWKNWLLSLQGVSWKLIFTVAAAVLIGLGSIPIAYEISAHSRLEGSVQRTLAAPEKGFIKLVHVRPGDQVNNGQLLIEMDDRDLLLQKEKASNEISQLDSRYGKALATRDRSELAVIQAGIAEAKASLSLVEQQLKRTKLHSPFNGIILEGDLTQSLGAPVDQGDNLMTLSPSLDFRIILDANENDINQISIGQIGRVAFSADPSVQYQIRIHRMSPVAQIKNGKNVFEVEAEFIDKNAAQLRPGFKGLARLYIDDRPLLRIGYGKLRHWIDLQVWRWTGLT